MSGIGRLQKAGLPTGMPSDGQNPVSGAKKIAKAGGSGSIGTYSAGGPALAQQKKTLRMKKK